jgi:colanic acid/amylovoran biosynthesis glycosyltransferase
VNYPKTAYVLLWFPKPSETFIFREVMNLWRMGLPLKVFALYGELKKLLSPEMASVSDRVTRLGIAFVKRAPSDIAYWWKRDRETTAGLFRTVPLRRWRSVEVAGENVWAFFSGFALARLFEEEGIEHIHAPFANGPATAAWVASTLTKIPFSFTGRAVDIYPPDGALREKTCASVLVRTNTRSNVEYLKSFADGHGEKVHLIYNGYPLKEFRTAPVTMKSPFRILSLGRFARFKGYDVLLRAARLLEDLGLDFRLTMAGAGPEGLRLRWLRRHLGLTDRVNFPGYVTHDRVPDLFCSADVFVMPSVIHATGERDGIPNVVMEALLHRVPVVATDLAAISEVIVDRETGLLVPAGDPLALARAIREMTGNRDSALEMARKGNTRVLEQFDPERNHRKILTLYTDVISQLGRSEPAGMPALLTEQKAKDTE